MRKCMVCSLVVCELVGGTFYKQDLKQDFAGFFAGGGLGYQYTSGNVFVSDNASVLIANGYADANNLNICDTGIGQIGGSLVMGYGKFLICNWYAGTEFTLDIAANKSGCMDFRNHREQVPYGNISVFTRGTVPSLALRLGLHYRSVNSMLYVRLGGSYIENKFSSYAFQGQGFSNKRIVPLIGLGMERHIADNFHIRIEGDYRCPAKKTKSNLYGYGENGALVDPMYRATLRNESRGYSFRLMGVYHM